MGSRRKVPLTAATTELLSDYLAEHPRADKPTAPLFLAVPRPTGVRALDRDGRPAVRDRRIVVRGQANALAELSVTEVKDSLLLDWGERLRHSAWYKAVDRPAVFRANRLTLTAALYPELKFHSLRHTYASLRLAAGIPAFDISRFMGALEADDDARHLRAPIRGRPCRRDGRTEDEGRQRNPVCTVNLIVGGCAYPGRHATS